MIPSRRLPEDETQERNTQMSKYQVSIAKRNGATVKETVRRAVDLVGGLEKYVKPGQSVLLKPNYTGLLTPGTGAVTSLEVQEAIVLLLQEMGVTDITIGDGCGTVHIGTTRIFEETGVKAMADRLGVKTIDLNQDKMVEKSDPRFREIDKVRVSQTLYNVDLVINIPVIKTHAMTNATAASKNLKGGIAPNEKRRFHKILLHQAIADMLCIMPPVLTIVDGLVAQEGLGPAEGTPVPLDVIMAGDNTVAVDGVILEIMQMPLEEVKHLEYAVEMGLGSCDLNDIEVLGDPIPSIGRPFRRATTDVKEYPGVEIYTENACCGCISTMVIALNRMNAIGDLQKFKDLQVCCGTSLPAGVEIKNMCFLGRCTRALYAKYSKDPATADKVHLICEGCAPCALEVEEGIREVYHIDRSDPNFCFASAESIEEQKNKE